MNTVLAKFALTVGSSDKDRKTIDEISKFIADSQKKETEIDPFDDMYTFQDAVLSAFPEFYDRVYQVRGKDNIERLFNRILSASYNAPLEYNSGIGNTSTLPRYQKKNLRGMPQYYAQNTHPAIIDSEA